MMDSIVNVCVIVTVVFAFGYLCYAMLRPERF
jgi:K+-transporting ATPase KdpF subunit